MGSLGSRTINDKIFSFIDKFRSKNYSVIIVTGNSYYEKVKDKREKRGVLFFLFTIIGVAFVILLALLIPYFFYWRSKRKMLDRLNYEIIYRRVDDVQKEMLNTAE